MVAAALQLIAPEGDAAITVRRVAVDAQIPTSSLYELISPRDPAREAVVREICGRVLDARGLDGGPAQLN